VCCVVVCHTQETSKKNAFFELWCETLEKKKEFSHFLSLSLVLFRISLCKVWLLLLLLLRHTIPPPLFFLSVILRISFLLMLLGCVNSQCRILYFFGLCVWRYFVIPVLSALLFVLFWCCCCCLFLLLCGLISLFISVYIRIRVLCDIYTQHSHHHHI
jgi:hypothetical protein